MKRRKWIALGAGISALVVVSSIPIGGRPEDGGTGGPARRERQATADQALGTPRPQPRIREGQGFIPPPMDLGHLGSSRAPLGALQQPVTWDWRTRGGVTGVKNQNPYGTCWAFAALGDLESKVMIGSGITRDYAEHNIVSCAGNHFCDLYGYSCNAGGNAWIAVGYLAQLGSVMESCDQYPGSCPALSCSNPSCPYKMSVREWRVITGDAVGPGDESYIKDAIVHYGPVYTAMYSGWAEFQNYDTDTCLTYSGTEETDHAVLIVGYNDTLCGGAWIVKNSWGTSWGDNGYFYIKYGNARIGSYTSVITDYRFYDERDSLYCYDEYAYNYYAGWSDDTDWGMVEFTPAWSGELYAVEIWTTSDPCNYRIVVYDDFSGGSLVGLLAGPIDGSLQESGYYSIELPSPVAAAQNDPLYIAVRFNTPGFQFCLPLDHYGPMETNKSWASNNGSVWIAEDMGDAGFGDLGIRARIRPQCDFGIPRLDIEIIGTEVVQVGIQQFNRFWVEVVNRSVIPEVMLEPAPDLYPYSPDNSRAHIELFDASTYQSLGSFDEITSPDDLDSLYFDVWTALQPPDSILLLLGDDRCYISYGSDVALVPSLSCGRPVMSIAGCEEVSYADSLWEIRIALENEGPGIAYDVSATMSHSLPWLVIPDPAAYYGNVPFGAASHGGGDTYTLDIADSPGDSFSVALTVTCMDVCGTPFQSLLYLYLYREVTGAETPQVDAFRLVQNYPNPFNPTTTIQFYIPVSCQVAVKIFDVRGRLIRTLLDEHRGPGMQAVTWNGTDDCGAAAASGIYFYRLSAASYAETKKMVLIR